MAEGAAAEDLLYRVEGVVGHITFNRPQARNAMTFAMYDRLTEICSEADPNLRAIIITGAGDKAFASGTDISQFRAFTTPEDALGYEAARFPPLQPSPAPAPGAERPSPRHATCGLPSAAHGLAFPSPAPWVTACPCPTTSGLPPWSARPR